MCRIAMPLVVAVVLTTFSGCVYFNTFYNAKRLFHSAEKQYKSDTEKGQRLTPSKQGYQDAIEKAAKIVQKHPKSKYHDDALFLIGVSYFRIESFSKAEGAFRELLATHPKSGFAEESQLYLARCRMQLGDEQAAFRAFTELAATARKSEWRAEAIFQRAQYFANNGAPDSAAAAFQLILDEYDKSERAPEARLFAAAALRQLKRPAEAIVLYQPLVRQKNVDQRYLALTGIGQSWYEAGSPDSGIAIFAAMADDNDYADSIGSIRLNLALGLKSIGDMDGAQRQYEQVAATLEATRWSADAYFRLAEIKQFQENDLVAARELYEKSRQEYARGDLANLALTRSANIGKLERFRKELGREELAKGGARTGTQRVPYDPAGLPRLERQITYSPLAARPADYVVPTVIAAAAVDSGSLIGPPTPVEATRTPDNIDTFGPATPPELASTGPEENPFGPPSPDSSGSGQGGGSATGSTQVAAAEPLGPPIDSTLFAGPLTSAEDIAFNRKRTLLLPESAWWALAGGDSLLGPPSPVYLYTFGDGDLLGPPTPADSVLAAAAGESDRATKQEREAREAARSQRKEAFAKIEASATTQMELAELYRFDLAYPESALVEYDDIVDRYSGTPFAAKALLGAADIYDSELHDTTQAHLRLQRILSEYPYSDYASDAIVRLGLERAPADTAHPACAYAQAEAAYLNDQNPKAAIRLFKAFVERYPYSRLVPRAEFAIAAITERHFPSSDSSVVWAYQEIAANYPGTELAQAATQKLQPVVPRPKPRAPILAAKGDKEAGREQAKRGKGEENVEADADSLKLTSLPRAPRTKVTGQFQWPSSETGTDMKEHYVVYKILIDYLGQIADYKLIQPSPSEDINLAAERAVKMTTFWADSIRYDSLNMWYKFEIKVTPPAEALDEFDRLGVPLHPDQH
jgi:TolA-binding protein